MNRRLILKSAVAGSVAIMSPSLHGAKAQEATPEPPAGLINIRWQLDRITSGNKVTLPDDPTRYWVQFRDDGRLAIGADCNVASAPYKLTGSSVGLGDIISTLAACGPTTIVDEFMRSLKYVVSYLLMGDVSDQLVLEMMADGGQLIFNPVLTGVVWQWTEFEGGDDSVIQATDPSRYTLEFLEDGTARVLADCNHGMGPAVIDGSSIDLTMAVTRMVCPAESRSSDFLRYLDDAVSFVVRDGRLALSLPVDSGIAFFKPVLPAPGPATPVATPGS